MGKLVQVGTAAIRTPQGDFLPAEPIYRELTERDPEHEPEYIPEDVLFDLFADKCKNYIRKEKECRVKSSSHIKRT